MKEWVIGIVVSVFAFSVISLVLPNGSTAKFIKQLFSVIMIFILLQPFVNTNTFYEQSFVYNDKISFIQNDFLEYAHDKSVSIHYENINKILLNFGVENANVDMLYYTDENYNLKIEKVVINLENSVIKTDREHIDIIDQIKTSIGNYLSLDKNLVVIYD
ncbi:MAG: hypothetical protein E7340_03115 [Clostridiales bacterium]|nr:hypothetical protein [Clostridiales bacterium]